MSASICWRPVDKRDKTLRVGAPSLFMETMRKAGLEFPCTIGSEELPVLTGMAAVYGRNDENVNPFDELITLVEKYGSVELWASY